MFSNAHLRTLKTTKLLFISLGREYVSKEMYFSCRQNVVIVSKTAKYFYTSHVVTEFDRCPTTIAEHKQYIDSLKNTFERHLFDISSRQGKARQGKALIQLRDCILFSHRFASRLPLCFSVCFLLILTT